MVDAKTALDALFIPTDKIVSYNEFMTVICDQVSLVEKQTGAMTITEIRRYSVTELIARK